MNNEIIDKNKIKLFEKIARNVKMLKSFIFKVFNYQLIFEMQSYENQLNLFDFLNYFNN